MRTAGVLLVGTLTLHACGGSPTAPSAPSVVPPKNSTVVRGIVLAGLEDGAAVGMPLSVTNVVTYVDGTQASLTDGPVWSSSNPAVATIDANGLVTPVAEGRTVIQMGVKGASASQELTVFMNVEGTWQFSYFPTSGCGQGGSETGMGCRRAGPTEVVRSVAITQRGRQVSMTAVPSHDLMFPGVRTVSGVIGEDRTLRLSGSACSYGDWTEVGFVIRDWDMRWSETAGAFEGQLRWEQNGPYRGCSGGPTNYSIQIGANVWNFRRVAG